MTDVDASVDKKVLSQKLEDRKKGQGDQLINFGGNFNQSLIMGVDLPTDLQPFFHGIDSEIQLSKIPKEVVEYGLVLIEYIMKVTKLYLNTEDPRALEVYDSWIDEANMKHKYLIRGFRGIGGFTIEALNTFYHRTYSETRDEVKKRRLSAIAGKFGARSGTQA